MYTTPLYRKIIQTPGLLVILNEREATYRQIFTDGTAVARGSAAFLGRLLDREMGRRHAGGPDQRAFATACGWTANGSPLTESGKITERIRRVNFGTLEIEITVDDPKAYTNPWTVKLTQLLKADTDLLDYYCVENEKDGPHSRGNSMTKIIVSIGALRRLIAPAQWLDYPTPGVPRLPDGKPNLTAPAPKTADGKPDLSGLWTTKPAIPGTSRGI